MKKDIHPTYYPDAKITCACGTVVTAGSTVKELHVELCSNCHPFYTGKQKLVDTARRVDKFNKKLELKEQAAKLRRGKKAKKEKQAEIKSKKVAKVDEEGKIKEKLTGKKKTVAKKQSKSKSKKEA